MNTEYNLQLNLVQRGDALATKCICQSFDIFHWRDRAFYALWIDYTWKWEYEWAFGFPFKYTHNNCGNIHYMRVKKNIDSSRFRKRISWKSFGSISKLNGEDTFLSQSFSIFYEKKKSYVERFLGFAIEPFLSNFASDQHLVCPFASIEIRNGIMWNSRNSQMLCVWVVMPWDEYSFVLYILGNFPFRASWEQQKA